LKLWTLLFIALLPLAANAVEVGDTLAPWTLLDQYDQPYTFGNDAQILLVARSMDAAKIVNGALQDTPKTFLESRHAVFVADIQKMPAIIAKMFAVPAMRAYSYRVMLDRESRVVPRYSGDVDKVLMLKLHNGKVVSQAQFDSAQSLRGALAQP
jgi:hypothetical protein